MSKPEHNLVETDPRFPSGRWTGYFLQKALPPGKHHMDLLLTFAEGKMTGEGRDRVGAFLIRGRYQLHDGRCHWSKRYVGKHDVAYAGFNEGRGIWGVWEVPSDGLRGGFYIWPEEMPEPLGAALFAEADLPAEATVEAEPLAVP